MTLEKNKINLPKHPESKGGDTREEKLATKVQKAYDKGEIYPKPIKM